MGTQARDAIPIYPCGCRVRVTNPASSFFRCEGVVYSGKQGLVWVRVWKLGVEASVGFREQAVERVD